MLVSNADKKYTCTCHLYTVSRNCMAELSNVVVTMMVQSREMYD